MREMLKSFYVDDLITGHENTNDACLLYEKSEERMACEGFKLRKWMTNEKALRDHIEQSESPSNAICRNEEEETCIKFMVRIGLEISKGCQKVLGLHSISKMIQFSLASRNL